ncbi:hypothetical protein M3661_27405 [Paenibacillus sp. MER 180]|uniref:hypothetical protein n=1 Tax=unclassified Paenibacillus TaxID=185978 RepID=UPI0015865F06|nr:MULTISPECIES: hypothetical protein [unclassified Paenibacillus]MCM3293826.1 hypothetical protein [Paenibacillus sp. MER 180]
MIITVQKVLNRLTEPVGHLEPTVDWIHAIRKPWNESYSFHGFDGLEDYLLQRRNYGRQ